MRVPPPEFPTLQSTQLDLPSRSSSRSQRRRSNPAFNGHVRAPVQSILASPTPPRIHPTFYMRAHLRPLNLLSIRSSSSRFHSQDSSPSSHPRLDASAHCRLQNIPLTLLCRSSAWFSTSQLQLSFILLAHLFRVSGVPSSHLQLSFYMRAHLLPLNLLCSIRISTSRLHSKDSSSRSCHPRLDAGAHCRRQSTQLAFLWRSSASFSMSRLQLSFIMIAHQLLYLKYTSRSPQRTFIMLAHQLLHLKYTLRFLLLN